MTVGLDRGYGRSGDLIDVPVFANPLVGNNIAVCPQIFIGPIGDLALGDLLKTGHLEGVILPVMTVDEGIDIGHGPSSVAFELGHLRKLDVVDGGLDQFIVEVSGTDPSNLFEHEVTHIIK